MKLEHIQEVLSENSDNPVALSKILLELSGDYSFYSSCLAEIESKKPTRWLALREREEVTSDKQADRLWDAEESGREEIWYTKTLKGIEKLLPAIKKRIEILQMEAQSQM